MQSSRTPSGPALDVSGERKKKPRSARLKRENGLIKRPKRRSKGNDAIRPELGGKDIHRRKGLIVPPNKSNKEKRKDRDRPSP